ncbi:MAG: Fur family transcriptional regulator [Myxococcota bacterium]|nr:Fur family transcriptional regulator [Myxococcota bacterium]
MSNERQEVKKNQRDERVAPDLNACTPEHHAPASLRERLLSAGIRPTQQRLELARLLFQRTGDRHVSARELFDEANEIGLQLSLATVYNTLSCFVDAGLLRALSAIGDEQLFDTNVSRHAHLICVESGQIWDASFGELSAIRAMVPPGFTLQDVELTLKLRPQSKER